MNPRDSAGVTNGGFRERSPIIWLRKKLNEHGNDRGRVAASPIQAQRGAVFRFSQEDKLKERSLEGGGGGGGWGK